MKILIAIPYFPPALGGMEKHVYTIAKGLKQKYGWEIVVVTSNHEENKYKEEILEGMKIYRLKRWFKISNTPINPLWYFQIKRIIKKEKPDIVNGRAPVPFMVDMAALASGDIPFILGYHFPSMKKGNLILDMPILIYEKTLLKKTIGISKLIICSSEFVNYNFFKGYSDKTITITQGINEDKFKPNKKVKEKYDVLFVGNFATPLKGLDYLLESISIIKTKIANIQLAVVGDGNLDRYKKIVNDLGINNNVLFLGELSEKDLVKIYQESKTFVLPSLNENFPSVLLEAMACKKPVIGTNVGGIPYIINNNKNGLLVPPKNPQALTIAIIKLLKNPKLTKKLAEQGYKSVNKRYNWNNRIKKINELFLKVLKENENNPK